MLEHSARSRAVMHSAAALLVVLTLAVAACSKAPAPEPVAAPAAATPPAAAAPALAAPAAPASFINRVWSVAESPSVAPGQLYVFLSEGTLVIASATGTPTLGRWQEEGGELQMIEEGQPAVVDVLNLTATEFKIKIHGPGEPIDMTLVPASTRATAASKTP
jgi:hypothetical protein